MATHRFTISIEGQPAQQGSKSPFVNKHTGRAMLVDVNRSALKPWRQMIAHATLEVIDDLGIRVPLRACCLELDFHYMRPRSHVRRDGSIRPGREYKNSRPDIDKLARAVLDALTGIVYSDDSCVVELIARKHYSERAGLAIGVTEL